MRLHTTRRAPNPRRVHMFLAEKGLEIETVEVALEGKACLPGGAFLPGSNYLKGNRDRSDLSYSRPLPAEGGTQW